jgi:hypothetical protein
MIFIQWIGTEARSLHLQLMQKVYLFSLRSFASYLPQHAPATRGIYYTYSSRTAISDGVPDGPEADETIFHGATMHSFLNGSRVARIH